MLSALKNDEMTVLDALDKCGCDVARLVFIFVVCFYLHLPDVCLHLFQVSLEHDANSRQAGCSSCIVP